MSRCAMVDHNPAKAVRCTEPAVWLHRRSWLCDAPAYESFRRDMNLRDVPRDQGYRTGAGAAETDSGWSCAPWVPELVAAKLAEFEARVLPAQTLFQEAM